MFDPLDSKNIALLFGACSGLWVVNLYINFRRLAQKIDNVPGSVTVFGKVMITRIFPAVPGVLRGFDWAWRFKYSEYKAMGVDILGMMALLPRPSVILHTADAEVIKEITANRAAFPKPIQNYKILNFFGENVVSTEHDHWKRHRKVVAKAFNEPNNKLVWQETVDIVFRLFDHWKQEGRADEIVVESAVDLTRDLALMVISSAAFGMSISWKDDDTVPPGHSMTFKNTLHAASAGSIHRLVLPYWILNLYSVGRQSIHAYNELRAYMIEMTEERSRNPGARQDLLSNLITAQDEDKDGSTVFSDADLMGNIFVLLFAGHDTTSHALAFALGLIALYPEVQNRLLAEINEVVAPGQVPTYAELPSFTYAFAILQETLRLFPIATNVSKYSLHDAVLTTENTDGSKRMVPVPAGTSIVLNVIGLHYNPKYWEDPEEFRPERFLGEYNKNAWAPFSIGARACIGRRFFEIEFIAVLTLFVKYYRIEVTYDPKFAAETFEERKKRVLTCGSASSLLRAKKVPLTFKRR